MLTLLLLHLSRKYKEKTSSDRSPERVILQDPLGEVERDRWPGFATPGKIGGHDNRRVAFFSSLNLVDFQRGLCHLCLLYHLYHLCRLCRCVRSCIKRVKSGLDDMVHLK
jgi:hypothetical protein